MDATSDTKGLVNDIFLLSGQKVEVDDPIVVAALIHSQLIRRAGQDAMTAIQSSVDKVLVDLAEAVKNERQAAVDAGLASARAVSQVVEAAKAATEIEVPKLNAQFVSVAQDVLQQIRREASKAAPSSWKIRVALTFSLAMLVAAVAGGVVGAAWLGKPTEQQAREIAAGKDFLNVLPQLDEATRDRIARLVEKSRQ